MSLRYVPFVIPATSATAPASPTSPTSAQFRDEGPRPPCLRGGCGRRRRLRRDGADPRGGGRADAADPYAHARASEILAPGNGPMLFRSLGGILFGIPRIWMVPGDLWVIPSERAKSQRPPETFRTPNGKSNSRALTISLSQAQNHYANPKLISSQYSSPQVPGRIDGRAAPVVVVEANKRGRGKVRGERGRGPPPLRARGSVRGGCGASQGPGSMGEWA
eukprot:gene14177-biopygen9586